MKSLMIGGAGFIGSHLADALFAKGEDITVLDNYSKLVSKNTVLKTLQHILK